MPWYSRLDVFERVLVIWVIVIALTGACCRERKMVDGLWPQHSSCSSGHTRQGKPNPPTTTLGDEGSLCSGGQEPELD
jgi:hypothetical protein